MLFPILAFILLFYQESVMKNRQENLQDRLNWIDFINDYDLIKFPVTDAALVPVNPRGQGLFYAEKQKIRQGKIHPKLVISRIIGFSINQLRILELLNDILIRQLIKISVHKGQVKQLLLQLQLVFSQELANQLVPSAAKE